MNRITVSAVKFAVVGLITAAAAIAAESARIANFEVTEIAPGNFVHYASFDERSAANLGDNANIGFIVGKRCVLVVDAGGSLPVGQALRRAIGEVTPLPVCHVILTHVHPDHFFGAAAFADDQPEFIAHENYPAQLAARARPYLNALRRDLGDAAEGSVTVKPTRLVKTEMQIDLGGRTVRVRAWPPAHTDDDLTVYDETAHTFWLSDLLFVDHTPVVDATITGYLAVMADLRRLPAAHYVPGHGRGRAPWPAALDPQERYLRSIMEQTRAAIRAKKTIQQAADEVGREEQGNWRAFETFHRRNVTTAYTELEWE
jgi:quinoprotein relay system zinc metallohydrolase 2